MTPDTLEATMLFPTPPSTGTTSEAGEPVTDNPDKFYRPDPNATDTDIYSGYRSVLRHSAKVARSVAKRKRIKRAESVRSWAQAVIIALFVLIIACCRNDAAVGVFGWMVGGVAGVWLLAHLWLLMEEFR